MEEKLNREMQIPLNNLTKLMAPVEPGLVGAQGEEGDRIWCTVKGLRELDPELLLAPSVALSLSPVGRNDNFSARRGFVPSRASQAHARSRWSPS